jgi:hypothetical protein
MKRSDFPVSNCFRFRLCRSLKRREGKTKNRQNNVIRKENEFDWRLLICCRLQEAKTHHDLFAHQNGKTVSATYHECRIEKEAPKIMGKDDVRL